jgi:hypothetical protein
VNWDAIGSIAEVIGAIAVVASLVYLGGQIQQNTKQLRIAGRQASQSSLQGTIFSQTEPTTADLIVRGFDGYLRLSKAEKLRFNGQMLNMFLDFQLALTLHTEGAFPDEGLAVHRRWIIDILSTPGGREWWSLDIYVEAATRDYINGFISRGEGKDVRQVLFPGDA